MIFIVLLDWNQVINEPGYLSHFVPIVGWDRNNVLVYQLGLPENPESYSAIDKQTFELARHAVFLQSQVLCLTLILQVYPIFNLDQIQFAVLATLPL